MPESLWLKSADSSSAHHFEHISPSAVLCTDDRTYQLRQVQSSNSLYILQPSESSRGNDEQLPSDEQFLKENLHYLHEYEKVAQSGLSQADQKRKYLDIMAKEMKTMETMGWKRMIDRIRSQGLLAIAQCTSTLELNASDTAASSALALQILKKTLPPYRGADTDIGSGIDTTLSSKRKRTERSNAMTSDVEHVSREVER